MVKVKTGLTPILPMTPASHKDLLLFKFQEFVSAHQTADRARSDMHCIIAELPGGEKTDEPSKPEESKQTAACSHCENQTFYSLMESGVNTRNRPIVTKTLKPDTIDPEPVTDSKPVSKSVARRMSSLEKRAAIQEALIYHAANPHLTQEQIAIHHGLEPKALSRSYAKKLKKSMAPNREKTPKDVADDYLYNEKRQKKW
jgi:uncharacterized coiled-coil protein SlyX